MEAGNMAESDWQCDRSLLDCLDYLFTSGTASDVAFVVNGGKAQILAHKTILVSRSSVFCTMLDDPTISKWEITLLDTQQHIFSIFLRYLYTDHIELTVDIATSVLPLARQYCVNHLVRKCETFLKENFASQNAVMFLQNSSRLSRVNVQDDDMNDNEEEEEIEMDDDKKPGEFLSSDQKVDDDGKEKSCQTDIYIENLSDDEDDKHSEDNDEDGGTHVNVADVGGDKHLVDADEHSEDDKHLVDADEHSEDDKHLTDGEDDKHLFDDDLHHSSQVKNVPISKEKSRTPVITALLDKGSAMNLTAEPSTSKVLPEKLYEVKEFSAPTNSGEDEEMVDVQVRRVMRSHPEEPLYAITSMVRGLVPKCLEINPGWQPHSCGICGKTFFDLATLRDHENTHRFNSEDQTVSVGTPVSHSGDYKPILTPVSGPVFSVSYPSSDFSDSVGNTNQVSNDTISKVQNLESTDEVVCKEETVSDSEEDEDDDDDQVPSLWSVSTETNPSSSSSRSPQPNQYLRINMAEMPYSCQICGRGFQLESQLEKHSKIHSWKKTFKCYVCNEKFTDKSNLESHLQIHAKDPPKKDTNNHGYDISCKYCWLHFRFDSNYTEHVKSDHKGLSPHPCEMCEKEFKSRYSLRQHMTTHTGKKPHVCKVCGKSFGRKISLKDHNKKHTATGDVYSCSVCGDKFRTASLLREHRASHSQVLMISCGRCGKEFSDESSYVKHLDTHGVSMTLACEHCELEFEDEELYQVHCTNEHEGLQFDEPGSLSCGHCPKTFRSEKAFNNHQRLHMIQNKNRKKCETCNLVFSSLDLLQQHSQVHDHSPAYDRDKSFQCEICGKQYKHRVALNRHVMFHTGEWKHRCDVCGRGLSTAGELKKHMLTHSSEKAHMCDVCGNQYKNQVTLDRHLMVHRGDRPHVCEICGKGYTDKYQLKMHLKAHAREKPHKCDVCRKGFDEADELVAHTLEHMGKKLFKCDICSKFYSRDSALKVHMRIHTGEKPYRCEICGKKFTNLGDKQRHIKIHTGEKPFVCGICGKGFSDKKYLRKHTNSNAHKPNRVLV